MARGDGALGSLSQDQFGSLSKGFDMSNPIGSLGGLDVNKSGAIGATFGMAGLSTTPVGLANTAIDAYGRYSAEKAAQSALGMNRGFIDTVTGMVTNPAMDTARDIADTNKDGKVSTKEAQNFGMNKGLTAYNVGRNPMQGYTPGTVNVNTLGKIDPTGGVVGGYESKTVSPTVYTQQQVDNITSGVGQGVGATGDLGGATGAGYSFSASSISGMIRFPCPTISNTSFLSIVTSSGRSVIFSFNSFTKKSLSTSSFKSFFSQTVCIALPKAVYSFPLNPSIFSMRVNLW